ncbi:MAG: Gx transporter family protein [Lachnospiraceae bacterium]|nr:Gx transporter family protein [Lachnospiraceae bacterium]
MPDTKNIARIGMLAAVAFVLSYIESLLPLNLGIPGIKAGLSNIVVIFSIFYFRPLTAFGIAIVRIVLSGLAFGGLSGMVYSLAGGILSFVVMLLLKKTRKFSVYGVSVAGGVSHNIGQVLVAMAVLQNSMVIYYLPFLLVAGVVAGIITGTLAAVLVKRAGDSGTQDMVL